MIKRVGFGALLTIALAGAALWAYGIAVLQPLTEPDSRWWEMAQNNSYWARDLRWGGIVAACLALVVLAGGARRPALVVTGAGLGWITVDLLMDRADPGRPALLPALLASAALTAAAAVACARAGRRAEPSTRALGTAAVIGVLTSVSLLTVESPSDAEPQLPPTRLAVVLLHIALALIATLTAAAPLTGARAAVTTGVALTWAALAAFFPGNPPGERIWLFIALSGLAVAGIWWVSHPSANGGVVAAVFLCAALATPIIFVAIVYGTIVIGPVLTELAGNEPLNGDEDMILALGGVLSGLTVSRAARWARRTLLASPATS